MIGLLSILGIGLALLIAMTTLWTARRLRRPHRRTYASAVSMGVPGDPGELPAPRDYREWAATCRIGGKKFDLPVWDIAGDDADGPVVICSPGWGDSRLGALARVEALAPVASRIIAWDPPGAGEAPGLCFLGAREHEAIQCLVDQLAEDAQARGVALYGWSLGAGVSIVAAAEMAGDQRILGVVAESPYRSPTTPAFNVLRNMGMPWRINGPLAFWMLGMELGVGPNWRGFDRAEHAGHMSQPLLVLQGTRDEVCPVDDGRAIAGAATQGLFVPIEGAHHNDLWTDERFRPQCEHVVRDFLTSLRLRSREVGARSSV